jgi:guanylate kinase
VKKTGKTFIISGPSGVGKSTVLSALFAGRDDLYFSVSATTRQPRTGEVNGRDYHFISPEQFNDWIENGEFLEYAEYVGNFYGTPKRYVDAAMAEGKDVILDIEVQGATQVHDQRPETVRIFIAPPSWEELERRLTARGTDTPEKIQRRLLRAKVELQMAGNYNYFVVNDSVERAVEELRSIMIAEHCRPAERMEILNVNNG